MATQMRRLLIVDDEPVEALFLDRAFQNRREPIDIRHAINGEAALNLIGSFAPSLVLLDLNMPGMDGFDVLAAMKSDARTVMIPTLIFTSSDQPYDIDRCYRGHANAYLVKPHSPEGYRALADAIHRFWFEAASLSSPSYS